MTPKGRYYYGDWAKADMLLAALMSGLPEKNLALAVRKNAQELRDAMKLTIRDQTEGWPPLEPATIARKGSSKMLIDKADLMNGITDVKVDEMSSFVGVPRAVLNRDGEELVNIAAVHEFGSGKRNIPTRSFARTTYTRLEPQMAERLFEAAVATLRGEHYKPGPRRGKRRG